MSLNKPDRMSLMDANIVKIAVEMESENPQLKEFNQKIHLMDIIQDLCLCWGLINPEQYALKFSEKNNENYVTEQNRNEIKNGSVLKLVFSPSKIVYGILLSLSEGSDDQLERTSALKKLAECSTDITFSLEFINKKGLDLIISLIERGKFQGITLAYALASFVELMEHRLILWDILETPFINMVASYVNSQTSTPQPDKVVQYSLSILEGVVLNSSAKYGLVEKEVGLPNLVLRLENENHIIQQNSLSLINALFLQAGLPKQKIIASTLCSKQVRNVILRHIIQTGKVGTEMAHQLYVMQTLCIGLLEERMNTKMDPDDQDALEKIKELRKIEFELDSFSGGDSSRRQIGPFAKDYNKLSTKDDIGLDFTETPPGMLALDCMVYFARNHIDAYTKIFFENACRGVDKHECPFGRSSVELVGLLCIILRIGELPSEQNTVYHTLFFSHDHPFHELYCVCIVLLNKTWKEMKATTEDFSKVFRVVKDQITRALKSQPTNMFQLKQKLNTLPYDEIIKLWQQDQDSKEKWENLARPIVKLQELITPESVQLIKKQRLGYMIDGTRFNQYSQSGKMKDKFWFVRLSQNHKVLHYGDCDDKSVPLIEELPDKLNVADIKGLLNGKNCPHMKWNKKSIHLAFSLEFVKNSNSEEKSYLNFVAPDDMVYKYWVDGINALLGSKMASKEAEDDLEILLAMEIKFRLLDAEGFGIDIPQDPPPVPADPPNYDFFYDFNLLC